MFCSVVISRLTQHCSYIIEGKTKLLLNLNPKGIILLRNLPNQCCSSISSSVQDADAFEHSVASALGMYMYEHRLKDVCIKSCLVKDISSCRRDNPDVVSTF